MPSLPTITTGVKRSYLLIGTLRGRPYERGEIVVDERARDHAGTHVMRGRWQITQVEPADRGKTRVEFTKVEETNC